MLPFAYATVTLYNRIETTDVNGRTKISWKCTVLSGCFWTRKTVRSLVNGVAQLGETLKCRINASPAYADPASWQTLEDRTDRFTLSTGDIIVYGAVQDEIGDNFSESALRQKYARQGCMTVTVAKDFSFQGSPVPHYAAEGV